MKSQTYEISIVVQGKIDENFTSECINGLKKVFPSAEVILSTWEGSDVSNLNFDKIVFSPDPGAMYCDEVAGTFNNVNRQIVSTQAGLKAATKPYILKTRTDILFMDCSFLDFFGKYDGVPSLWVRNRLLICNYYTRSPRVIATCFHPSDWVLFGRAEDVRKYYGDIPLMTQEEGDWFRSRVKAATFFTNHLSRYTPEQYIFLHFLRRYEQVDYDSYYERTPKLIEQTEEAFAKTFVVLDYQKQLNIVFKKYNPNRYLEKHTLLSHRQWRGLYQHYCEKTFSLSWLAYRFSVKLFMILTDLRTGCVRLLNRIGIKEAIKRLLAAR